MKEVLNAPDDVKKLWLELAQKEYDSLIANKVWKLSKLPPGKKAISSKWVWDIKHNADGSFERRKARLIAVGTSQQYGLDYKETFAPTFRSATIKLVLAIAAIEDLHLRSVDISTAFLNGEMEEVLVLVLLSLWSHVLVDDHMTSPHCHQSLPHCHHTLAHWHHTFAHCQHLHLNFNHAFTFLVLTSTCFSLLASLFLPLDNSLPPRC
jgi:hypothetical protein